MSWYSLDEAVVLTGYSKEHLEFNIKQGKLQFLLYETKRHFAEEDLAAISPPLRFAVLEDFREAEYNREQLTSKDNTATIKPKNHYPIASSSNSYEEGNDSIISKVLNTLTMIVSLPLIPLLFWLDHHLISPTLLFLAIFPLIIKQPSRSWFINLNLLLCVSVGWVGLLWYNWSFLPIVAGFCLVVVIFFVWQIPSRNWSLFLLDPITSPPPSNKDMIDQLVRMSVVTRQKDSILSLEYFRPKFPPLKTAVNHCVDGMDPTSLKEEINSERRVVMGSITELRTTASWILGIIVLFEIYLVAYLTLSSSLIHPALHSGGLALTILALFFIRQRLHWLTVRLDDLYEIIQNGLIKILKGYNPRMLEINMRAGRRFVWEEDYEPDVDEEAVIPSSVSEKELNESLIAYLHCFHPRRAVVDEQRPRFDQLESKIIFFHDLMELDDLYMHRLLQDLPKTTFHDAIKGADPTLLRHCLNSLSPKVAIMALEDLEDMKAIRGQRIIEAQQDVLKAVGIMANDYGEDSPFAKLYKDNPDLFEELDEELLEEEEEEEEEGAYVHKSKDDSNQDWKKFEINIPTGHSVLDAIKELVKVHDKVVEGSLPFFLDVFKRLAFDLNTLTAVPVSAELLGIELLSGEGDLNTLFEKDRCVTHIIEDGLNSGDLFLVVDVATSVALTGFMMMSGKEIIIQQVAQREYNDEIQEGFIEVSNQTVGFLNEFVEKMLPDEGHLFLENSDYYSNNNPPNSFDTTTHYLTAVVELTVDIFPPENLYLLLSKGVAETLLGIKVDVITQNVWKKIS
jgi:hypothetical protein